MGWFQNRRVRTKLFLGFGLVMLLLAAVSGVALVSFNRVTADLHEMLTRDNVSEQRAAAMAKDFYALDGALNMSLASAKDSESARIARAAYETAFKDYQDARASLDSLVTEPDERALLKSVDAGFTGYMSFVEKMQKAQAAGDMAAAIKAQTVDNNDASDKLVGALEEFQKLQAAHLDETAEQLNASLAASSLLILALAGAAILLGVAVALVVAQSIARPLAAVGAVTRRIAERDLPSLAHVAKALAAGDLTQDAVVAAEHVAVESSDELGIMAANFNLMVDVLLETGEAVQEMSAGLREMIGQLTMAAGQLATASQALGENSGQTGVAAAQVAAGVQSVAEGFQTTRQGAQTTNDAVVQLNQAIDGIARGAADQASQVQAATATASQMAQGVEQVAASAGLVASTSEQTKQAAENGAAAVRDTVEGMVEIKQVVGQAAEKVEELGSLGEKIGAVVSTIDDIAEQTNLLALNAAIEAARAGEHGKGFAVVADEVRKLAERSGRETKQIAELIQQVQAGTQEAVEAMEQGSSKVEAGSERANIAGQALGEIVRAVDTTVVQVTEIASAAQEMTAGARQVVDAMQSISAVVEENSAATEEMTAQADQVRSAVENIAHTSEGQSAAIEEISAGTEEMAGQVESMGGGIQEVAAMAEQLQGLVTRFRLEASSDAREPTPIRRVVAEAA